MDIYNPATPRLAYIGACAAPGALPLTWLAQQCEVQIFADEGLDDVMREIARADVLLLDAHSSRAHLVCQQLRESEPSRHLPVLAVGRGLTRADVICLLRHGAVDVVALPTDHEVLLEKLRALAYRQSEIGMTRAINRNLLQGLQSLPPAWLSAGRATARNNKAGVIAVTGGNDLISRLERHATDVPEHVALYVIAALASTELLPLCLSSPILNSLTRRVPLSRLGPVHHAFADLVKRHLTAPQSTTPGAELALLQACDASRPAIEALRFVVHLPNLLGQPAPA